ncbi:type II toxin-antitoxin system RelE family toxin [Geminocystis herdmanii]|uniref:type II toxin-antitoxin system RelE family toxin n=1 Tax=Geminocystis herdmanii TaxID=669359 RepID=UPI00034AE87C|nr:type II toxin-antitoxin system RelE/ParE family toxin [Geminocystis herdmanii]
MIEYQIKFKSSSAKELKNLPSNIQKRIGEVLEKIKENPRISGVIKLQGDDKLYRIRVGDYRLVFEIDDSEKLIKITRVRHRQDVYKK